MRLFLLLAAVSLCVAQTPPATTQIKDIQIPRLTVRPKIEDFLEGRERSDMRKVDDFRQRNPGDGVPSSRKTAAYFGYDDKNLYAGFICEVKPGELRARIAKREDVFADDIVGVFLDTYHDKRHGYEFFVNAYGVQADALLNEGGNDEFSFDTLWYSDGRVTPTGFSALIVIPFKSLRFSPDEMQTWGIGAGRFMRISNENVFWPYITNRISGFTPQLGNGSGFEKISPGRNLQLIPYFSFGRSHFLDSRAPAPFFRSKNDPRIGLDAKAVLHDTLTLDVTLNPDFGQVESDDPQVTVNQRFEVFFPEKRPFFLENTGYFATPENLLFSRRIIDPEFGGRLTGKLGSWNLGILAADDRAPGNLDDPTNSLYGARAHIGVARIQHEIGKESSVGGLFTSRTLAGGFNYVEAADTRIKVGKNWTLAGQAILSQTEDTSGRRDGRAINAQINRFSRTWNYNLGYQDRTPGFHTDLGFVPRVDIRQANQFMRRNFYSKNSRILISASPRLFSRVLFDQAGRQQEWGVNPGFNLDFRRATFFGFGANRSFERYNNINFQHTGYGFGLHSEYFKKATVDFNLDKGTRLVYGPAGNLAPFRGDGRNFNMTLTVRPISRLKLDETYFYTSIHTRDDSFTARSPVAAHATVFNNHLIRSRLNYQFNKELSLRFIVDYNATLPNTSLVNFTKTKAITGDILFTYLLHPGTALYVGYTDHLENLGILPTKPPTLARLDFPSVTTGRQFFAKVSYLFRF